MLYLSADGTVYGGDRQTRSDGTFDPEIPDRPDVSYTWNGIAWEPPPPPTLEAIKAKKVAELDQLCTDAIDQGFESAALGAPCLYSSKLEDQFNLKATRDLALEFGAAVEYVCTDGAGLKAARSHTPQQISQVFFDGLALKRTLIFKFHTLRLQIEAATDAETVGSINWDR